MATLSEPTRRLRALMPAPRSLDPDGADFEIDAETAITYTRPAAADAAHRLAADLRPATGFELPVAEAPAEANAIHLREADGSTDIPDRGYRVRSGPEQVTIEAAAMAGFVAAIATVRQLLPGTIESDRKQPGPWLIAGADIRDGPRFGYRGAQLDVARHFFPVADIKRFIDLVAGYKINHLHLHLTDNEGWRLEIESWPRLTEAAAATDIDGGAGGYYTQAEFTEIVEYATARGITVVPEIDMPAHTGAAVMAYPELCHGDAPRSMPADSGTLAVDRSRTYDFVEDVLTEVAELTPGPYLHIGADEADTLSDDEYSQFVETVLPLVADTGKRPVAWQEVTAATPTPDTVVQYWKDTEPPIGDQDVIFSPNTHTYLNFRYAETTPPDGPETWGRRITSVPTSYDWDPGSYYEPVAESAVLGAEFALWSEELATYDDVTYMALPRAAGVAERAWSPPERTGWDGYADRLAAQAPRWCGMGVQYYRSPAVDWTP